MNVMNRCAAAASVALAVAFGAVSVMAPAAAHHSVAGQFDYDQPVKLTGVISEIDWINPHINLYLDVQEEDGSITKWRLTSLPTTMLRRAGLTKAMLMADGATVEVEAIRARDGTTNLAWVLAIHYPDGYHYQMSGG